MRGVPREITFNTQAVTTLYHRIAEAVGLDINQVEVHIESTQYLILKPNGFTTPASDVHIFVEWTGRPFEVKIKVAEAIYKFLKAHGLESDITFRDSKPGTFFVNGKLIGQPPIEST